MVSFLLSARMSSTTIDGGELFSSIEFGSTTTTPRVVGNQSRPSTPFQPAGLATPLHCTLDIPSAFPYDAQLMVWIFPWSKSSRSFFFTRKTPEKQLIQRLSRPSSKISKMLSLNKPCFVV